MSTDRNLYTFKNNKILEDWMVEDDAVMGGKSKGYLHISEEEHAIFKGNISLENDGGFSQIQTDLKTKDVSDFSKFKLEVKGDGKEYQLRVKEKTQQEHVYKNSFTTSGEWETIELPFEKFSPRYHGEDLDQPNYNGKTLGHMAILIGNGKEESFEILVKKISME